MIDLKQNPEIELLIKKRIKDILLARYTASENTMHLNRVGHYAKVIVERVEFKKLPEDPEFFAHKFNYNHNGYCIVSYIEYYKTTGRFEKPGNKGMFWDLDDFQDIIRDWKLKNIIDEN